MKEMIKRMREEKGGFTLAELLIVVAIVMVLVAIAVPIFTGALDKADQAVQQADIRAVKAAAATEILLEGRTGTAWNANATVDKNGNMGPVTIGDGALSYDDVATKDPGTGSYYVEVSLTATDVS